MDESVGGGDGGGIQEVVQVRRDWNGDVGGAVGSGVVGSVEGVN